MNLVLNLEILIFFQNTLSQYIPNNYLHHQQYYTRAAYFEQYHDDEYNWTTSENQKHYKTHKRREKYTDYYISAEMDYGPKRLKCKCSCKKRYEHTQMAENEQSDPCCQSYCDHIPSTSNGLYTSYPASMIYPQTINLTDLDKYFPWINYWITTTEAAKSTPTTEVTNTVTEEKPSTKKPAVPSTTKFEEIETKPTTMFEVTGTTTQVEDKETKTTTKVQEIETETTTNAEEIRTTTSTKQSTHSTVPYTEKGLIKLFKYVPKKKSCVRENCIHNDNRKIGRYYKNELVERPTIASFFNSRRRANSDRFFYDDESHYGIISIPDSLSKTFMKEMLV